MIIISRKGENIRKRRDGRWEGRYIVNYDNNGKSLYKSVYAKSYLEVKNKMKLHSTNLTPNDIICTTVKTALENWLYKAKIKTKQSTYSRYHDIVYKHIVPILGDIKISHLTNDTLNRFVLQKVENGRLDGKGGLSPKTISDITLVLKQALNSHCAFRIDITKPTSYKKEIRVLTEQEQIMLEQFLLQDIDSPKLGIFLALYTGLRLGELCSLKWENIDFDNKILTVNKTMQRIKDITPGATHKTKIIIDSPKSNNSNRTIPIPVFLIKLLKQVKSNSKDNSYVLTGEVNRYIEPRAYLYRFKKYLKFYNLTDINFHALRHTFATRCMEKQFDIKSLSEILGHADIKITLSFYVHSSFAQKRIQMETLTPHYV